MDSNTAYIDTSSLIAFLDTSDSYHLVFKKLFSAPPKTLIVSELVISEGYTWFVRRYDSFKGMLFLNFLRDLKNFKIQCLEENDINKVSCYLKKFYDQKITFTDATGLYLMDKLKIKICWSTDKHFRLTGKNLIIDEF